MIMCSIKKPGQEWSEVKVLAHMPGWNCNIGSAVYDSNADRVIVLFVRKPVARNEFGKYSAEEEAEMQRRAEMKVSYANAVKALLDQGVMLTSRIVPGGEHCEASWEKQVPIFMNTLMQK